METAQASSSSRLLNPFVFHLEKLGLELKCPICLDLLKQPTLLPCNHIFCGACVTKSNQLRKECPACQRHFTDREIRPATHLENIATIYKSLKATFNSAVLPLLSTDSGPSVLHTASIQQLRKNFIGTEAEVGIKRIDARVEVQIESVKKDGRFEAFNNSERKEFERRSECVVATDVDARKRSLDSCPSKDNVSRSPVLEELDVNQAPEVSPGSSPSSGRDSAGHNCNQSCKDASRESSSGERSVRSSLDTASGVVDKKTHLDDAVHSRESKRQKRLNYESSQPVLQSHGCTQQRASHPNGTTVSNCHEDKGLEDKTSVLPLSTVCDESNVKASICAFCHSSTITEDTGPMVHYANGKEATRGEAAFSRAIPVHRTCIDWTPKVYYSGDRIKNLESELARASKLKCKSCGLNGAALGCFRNSCRRTYHVPCALKISECRWDCDDYLMLCPVHKSTKFPSEKFGRVNQDSGDDDLLTTQIASEPSNFWKASRDGPQEWALCGSALSAEDKCLMVEFGKISGNSVFKFWDPNVTHVIAATDANGACSRTLKVLMAILNGRWVLTIDWVKACVEANSPVSEEPYEINLDNHGVRDGPRTGRLRASSNAPKLFSGSSFYFSGDFVPAYKNDLLDLVTAGGGIIIPKVEQIAEAGQEQAVSTNFVVYNRDHPQTCLSAEAHSLILKRLADAKDVAKLSNAQVIPHTWILESIAASRVLPAPLC